MERTKKGKAEDRKENTRGRRMISVVSGWWMSYPEVPLLSLPSPTPMTFFNFLRIG